MSIWDENDVRRCSFCSELRLTTVEFSIGLNVVLKISENSSKIVSFCVCVRTFRLIGFRILLSSAYVTEHVFRIINSSIILFKKFTCFSRRRIIPGSGFWLWNPNFFSITFNFLFNLLNFLGVNMQIMFLPKRILNLIQFLYPSIHTPMPKYFLEHTKI